MLMNLKNTWHHYLFTACMGFALWSAIPLPATATSAAKEEFEVTSVTPAPSDLYYVKSLDRIYPAKASAASDLASLSNMDALSEDWFCRIDSRPTGSAPYYTLDCSNTSPSKFK
jgi:hypothetical protein